MFLDNSSFLRAISRLRRMSGVVSLVFCLLSLQGCDFIYRLLDKEGAEEKELVGEISPFESNPTVEEVQTLLKIYGYSPGTPDGVLGLRTRNAIEKFQKDHGLKPSRFVDDETWEKLSVFKKNGLLIEGEVNIRLVQEILEKAGYDVGGVDGNYGPKSKKALEQFQTVNKLKVDGKIGYKTLSALAQYLQVPMSNNPY